MNEMTRRDTLKLGLTTAAGLALIPEWALPALAQGEVDVPFTDYRRTSSPARPTAPAACSTCGRSTA